MPPVIKRDTCIGCGSCFYICGKWVFSLDKGRIFFTKEKLAGCVHCFICQDICPSGAIRILLPRRSKCV